MAIGGNRASTGAEIVMGVRSVEGRRHVGVPDQVVRVLVLVRCREHVRLVFGGTINGTVGGYERGVVVLARIAGRAERMRPAEMQTVHGRQFLAHDQPGAVTCTLILEIYIRWDVTVQTFADDANRGLGREGIHDPELHGVFVRSVLEALLLCKCVICVWW